MSYNPRKALCSVKEKNSVFVCVFVFGFVVSSRLLHYLKTCTIVQYRFEYTFQVDKRVAFFLKKNVIIYKTTCMRGTQRTSFGSPRYFITL